MAAAHPKEQKSRVRRAIELKETNYTSPRKTRAHGTGKCMKDKVQNASASSSAEIADAGHGTQIY